MSALDSLVDRIASDDLQPVYLISGEAVLTEPAGMRLAAALGDRVGAEVTVVRRPAELAGVLHDLRTFSLFGQAKVVLALETSVLADRGAAADLIDQAAEVLPVEPGQQGGESERTAAGRLLQVLRLFDIAIGENAESTLSALPNWALQGGTAWRRRRKNRPRGRRQVEELRSGLEGLLELAQAAGLTGRAEGDLADLADVVGRGLPDGHVLVLAEANVAEEHPLVKRLRESKAVIEVGRVEGERWGGWTGLEPLVQELQRETGSPISRSGLDELARRTLRRSADRKRPENIDPDSTARFGAEYRKLAALTAGGEIDLEAVRSAVEDRGEEDVWQLLDAVGAGQPEVALSRFRRLLQTAEDQIAVRFSFFALIAEFSRQLVLLDGLIKVHRLAAGERNYQRFKSRIAPVLQGPLPEGAESPLARLHPFRLHRVYLAASRLAKSDLSQLLPMLLKTELRLKGESGEGDVALGSLIVALASGRLPSGRVAAGALRL